MQDSIGQRRGQVGLVKTFCLILPVYLTNLVVRGAAGGVM